MNLSDYSYDLPPELIAQAPLAERCASRLLHVPPVGNDVYEYRFSQLEELLRPNDLLVLNDTRVIPGRLFGRKATGGQVEMLLERILEPTLAQVQLRSSRSPVVGSEVVFEPDIKTYVEAREGRFFMLRFTDEIESLLDAHGHVPLPPYIQRADADSDKDRYQTVYARDPGAVAAPTAGLHFDEALLSQLAQSGVQQTTVTLHVGAGTFLPLDREKLESGKLHAERISVDEHACAAVAKARAAGGRIIAVGTTAVRALESAAVSGSLSAFEGETDIFIRPGSTFNVVDAMITNFHLPESSLLMLVAAFRGREEILAAYHHAIEQQFRFFSYGDAMFVERRE